MTNEAAERLRDWPGRIDPDYQQQYEALIAEVLAAERHATVEMIRERIAASDIGLVGFRHRLNRILDEVGGPPLGLQATRSKRTAGSEDQRAEHIVADFPGKALARQPNIDPGPLYSEPLPPFFPFPPLRWRKPW